VPQPQALSAALLLGDAYLALGDFDRAGESYQEALRQVTPPPRPVEAAQLEKIVRSAIESLDKARAFRQ
jgi:cytochrome c-type biogenesis protein CcmH/NrfG